MKSNRNKTEKNEQNIIDVLQVNLEFLTTASSQKMYPVG